MTVLVYALAQVGGGAAPAPIGPVPLGGAGFGPQDLWLPILILLAVLVYWLWLRRSVPAIRTRRDIVRAVAIHLLAAMALNIAVAWTGALLYLGIFRNGVAPPWVGAGPNPRAPQHVALYRAGSGPGCTTYLGLADNGPLRFEQVAIQAGFPLPSLIGVWHDPRSAGVAAASHLMLPVSHTTVMARGARVPVKMAPVGFAVNTAVYAAALALPLTRFPLRRQYRLLRGACAECGYNMSGLAGGVCPECGTAPA